MKPKDARAAANQSSVKDVLLLPSSFSDSPPARQFRARSFTHELGGTAAVVSVRAVVFRALAVFGKAEWRIATRARYAGEQINRNATAHDVTHGAPGALLLTCVELCS